MTQPPDSPVPPSSPSGTPVDPQQAVNGPALALMIAAALGILARLALLLLNALGMAGSMMGGGRDAGINAALAAGGMVGSLLTVAIGVVIIVGAMKMRQLKSYPFAMTAVVLGFLPCSSCCCFTLPVAIWALVVLLKPEVKAAFR